MLTSSVNPVLLSNPITLQATVASSSGTPTGSIAFYDGAQLLGSSLVDNTGRATLPVTIGAMGAHSLTAAYSGDASFASEISAAVPQIVEDFTLSPPVMLDNNTCECHLPAGTSVYRLSINPLGGATFPSAIALSVSGLPSGTTASLAPVTLAAGAGATQITLTLQKQVVAGRRVLPGPQGTFAFVLSLMIPSIAGWRRQRRRSGWRPAKLFVRTIAGGLLCVAAGCGSSNGTPMASSTTPATPAYSIIITATSGLLQRTATVTVTTL